MSTHDPLTVQRLASRNPAASLVAASAARQAAEIVAHHKPRAIPGAIAEAVERYGYLLRAAIGSAGELDEDEC